MDSQVPQSLTENRADLCKCGHPRYTHNGCCEHCGPKCRDFRLQQSQRNVVHFHRDHECPRCHHLTRLHDQGPGNICRHREGSTVDPKDPCGCSHFASYDEMNLLPDDPPAPSATTDNKTPLRGSEPPENITNRLDCLSLFHYLVSVTMKGQKNPPEFTQQRVLILTALEYLLFSDTGERFPDHQCHYDSHEELQRQHYDDDFDPDPTPNPDPESSCGPLPPNPPFTPAPGNSTDHYRDSSAHSAIDVIESWSLNFSLGSALKYIYRAALKPDSSPIEDLRKALWYLNREVKRLEKSPQESTVDPETRGGRKTEKGEQRGKVPVDLWRSTGKKANKIQI